MLRVKRVYETPEKSDGFRLLVDRVWPRGLSKEKADLDAWTKEVAPSKELRKWFGHDPKRWTEFKKRYFEELKGKKELTDRILEKAQNQQVTLLYGAKDENYNNAVALKAYLEQKDERG